ncbi:MAG TPA: hypothetical protein VHC22_22590 [Pirellulales bacterium]|nr:hypothetical protein [Pirellulales bacterium]
MPRQFSLKTLLWLMVVFCMLLGAGSSAWRFAAPTAYHKYPLHSRTATFDDRVECRTIWSDGSESVDKVRWRRNIEPQVLRALPTSEAPE